MTHPTPSARPVEGRAKFSLHDVRAFVLTLPEDAERLCFVDAYLRQWFPQAVAGERQPGSGQWFWRAAKAEPDQPITCPHLCLFLTAWMEHGDFTRERALRLLAEALHPEGDDPRC